MVSLIVACLSTPNLQSGLTQAVLESKVNMSEVEQRVLSFVVSAYLLYKNEFNAEKIRRRG